MKRDSGFNPSSRIGLRYLKLRAVPVPMPLVFLVISLVCHVRLILGVNEIGKVLYHQKTYVIVVVILPLGMTDLTCFLEGHHSSQRALQL